MRVAQGARLVESAPRPRHVEGVDHAVGHHPHGPDLAIDHAEGQPLAGAIGQRHDGAVGDGGVDRTQRERQVHGPLQARQRARGHGQDGHDEASSTPCEANHAVTAARSAGHGACATTRRPLTGCGTSSAAACSARRGTGTVANGATRAPP